MAPGPSQRIRELDGWRGVSILFVVVSHVVNYRYSTPGSGDTQSILAAQLGTLGVSIFFVISGFVIARLAFMEQERTGVFSTGRFYVRRFFRIVPPFFLYLACLHVFSAAGWIEQSPWDTLVAGTFTCNIGSVTCGWFAGHSWSLAFEEQFYLVFPLVVALGAIRSRAFVSMLFPAIVAISAVHLFFFDLGLAGRAIVGYSFSFAFIAVGTFFAANEQALRRACESRMAPAFTALATLAVFGPLFLPNFQASPAVQVAWSVYLLCAVPLAAGWMVTSTSCREGVFARILRSAPLQSLGLISYSLYVWQQAFLAPRSLYLAESPLTIPVLALVVATASFHWIEGPARELGKRLLERSAHRR